MIEPSFFLPRTKRNLNLNRNLVEKSSAVYVACRDIEGRKSKSILAFGALQYCEVPIVFSCTLFYCSYNVY